MAKHERPTKGRESHPHRCRRRPHRTRRRARRSHPLRPQPPRRRLTVTKRALLVVAGDLHVNGTVALSPDKYQLDDGQWFYPSKPQKWINARWSEFWEAAAERKARYGAEVVTLLTGEL